MRVAACPALHGSATCTHCRIIASSQRSPFTLVLPSRSIIAINIFALHRLHVWCREPRDRFDLNLHLAAENLNVTPTHPAPWPPAGIYDRRRYDLAVAAAAAAGRATPPAPPGARPRRPSHGATARRSAAADASASAAREESTGSERTTDFEGGASAGGAARRRAHANATRRRGRREGSDEEEGEEQGQEGGGGEEVVACMCGVRHDDGELMIGEGQGREGRCRGVRC